MIGSVKRPVDSTSFDAPSAGTPVKVHSHISFHGLPICCAAFIPKIVFSHFTLATENFRPIVFLIDQVFVVTIFPNPLLFPFSPHRLGLGFYFSHHHMPRPGFEPTSEELHLLEGHL